MYDYFLPAVLNVPACQADYQFAILGQFVAVIVY